jgi:hypothetical protein
MRDATSSEHRRRDYRNALAMVATTDEVLASQFALLAGDLEHQGQAWIAAMLRQASHRHKAAGIKSRALASALEPDHGAFSAVFGKKG